MKIKAFILYSLIAQSLLFGFEKQDGYWWNDLPDTRAKLFYVIGVVKGLQLARIISYMGGVGGVGGLTESELTRWDDAYSARRNKYFNKNIINGQIVEGLDKLYSDYRNKNLEIEFAIIIVGLDLSGASEESAELLKKWRVN